MNSTCNTLHSLFILFETFQIFSKKEMATIAWHNLSTLFIYCCFLIKKKKPMNHWSCLVSEMHYIIGYMFESFRYKHWDVDKNDWMGSPLDFKRRRDERWSFFKIDSLIGFLFHFLFFGLDDFNINWKDEEDVGSFICNHMAESNSDVSLFFYRLWKMRWHTSWVRAHKKYFFIF